MDDTQKNAMKILRAMIERSRVWTSNGDVIKRITNLEYNEIDEAIPVLEDMGLVRTLPGRAKIRFQFFNVRVSKDGYKYYNEHFGKISGIE